MNKWISLILLLGFATTYGSAQCDFDTNARTTGWTQVGTGVSINGGVVDFVEASGSQQRRVHRALGSTLTSSDTWRNEFEFIPTELGEWSGQPAAGHFLLALTAGTQEPLNDCPDVACTGYPNGTQDGVMVNFLNPNPPDGTVNFQILHKQGGTELTSPPIPFVGLNTTYYITFERLGPNDYQLSVFSNSSRTNHFSGSPVSLNVPVAIGGLNTVQHGTIARGNALRELSGSIDDLCVRINPPQVVEEVPALPSGKLVLYGFLMLLVTLAFSRFPKL